MIAVHFDSLAQQERFMDRFDWFENTPKVKVVVQRRSDGKIVVNLYGLTTEQAHEVQEAASPSSDCPPGF